MTRTVYGTGTVIARMAHAANYPPGTRFEGCPIHDPPRVRTNGSLPWHPERDAGVLIYDSGRAVFVERSETVHRLLVR